MSLKARFDQLAERERKLLTIFGAIFGGMVLLLGPFLVRMTVGEKETRNQAYRDVIQQIADERVTLARRREEVARVDSRYARRAPALAGFLAQMADQSGVQIPETQDRSVVPHGKTFKERQTRIHLTKLGMLSLSNFLEKIAQSGYAVSLSGLDIQKRASKDDEFDAELDVSAYDREEVKKTAPKPAAADKAAKTDGADAAEEDAE